MFGEENTSYWDVFEILEVTSSVSSTISVLPVAIRTRALEDISELFGLVVLLMHDRERALFVFSHVTGLDYLYGFLLNELPHVVVIWNSSRMVLRKDSEGRVVIENFRSGLLH